MKITVIGGSGRIGSRLVQKLRNKGHEVVPASPNTGVNTLTGEGLAEALKNAEVVVDVANSPRRRPGRGAEKRRGGGRCGELTSAKAWPRR